MIAALDGEPPTGGEHRSGFVTIVGRPNVGKSTLLNAMVGAKVSIVSDKPQTTRNTVRGVATRDDVQVVFIDTPGLHRPRTRLGERLNRRALDALEEVDAVVVVAEADADVGPGDRFVSEHALAVSTPAVAVVNKVDQASPEDIAAQLARLEELGEFDAYVPVSALTGDGVDALFEEIRARLPTGPQYYPDGELTDQPDAFLAAEIVREKLLEVTRDEVPHSIAVVVDEIEDRPNGVLAIDAVVLVERESQKGIVIGKRGAVLKQVGTRAREELEGIFGTRVFLETHVRVEKDWQRRDHALDRLGY